MSSVDDGREKDYQRRLEELRQTRELEREQAMIDAQEAGDEYDEPRDELLEDGLVVPHRVWSALFPHQKEGIQWLYQLHVQNAGGILGDDMGLGKTVQIAAYLACLHRMRLLHSVLLACPASVLWQWVRELHKWVPELRVVLLHSSGSSTTAYPTTIAKTFEKGGVLLTTYENLRANADAMLSKEWDYVVLDEGHRIRNPDAEITLVCKQLRTVHRLILTGSPIQNRLKELWSLFDFVFPGKLGTFPTFEDEFVLPIRHGGYANATKVQILMAYKCALVLRDLIAPYMLRRLKKDVQIATALPDKMEQVIFCPLSVAQTSAYKAFLTSNEVRSVLARDARPFRALTVLRQLCNHPCLVRDVDAPPTEPALEDSGKLVVLQTILQVWFKQRHRVLVFAQHRRTLDLLATMLRTLGYVHCRLDGTTSVRERQALIDAYNAPNSDVFCFLLTTRAGGIGVNLTGADRVVIFDPDWNPSTDMQARERAWRLGQTKPVTIYRLITSGTIEEKIYHRQLFKQYLMNKVLRDPKQKRCFNHNNLHDLFVLSDGTELHVDDAGNQVATTGTETGDLYLHGHVPPPTTVATDTDAADDATGKEVAALQASLGNVARVERRAVATDDDAGAEDDADGDADARADDGGKDNAELLQTLFDGGGIKGVFSQDRVESDGVHNQEADLIEMESAKVAKSALSALRQSCSAIRQQRTDAFEVTWTGKSGSAGKRLFGTAAARGTKRPTSGAMLQKMKQRRNAIDGANRVTAARDAPVTYQSVDELTRHLHAFLAKHATTGVATDVIVTQFSAAVAPKDKEVFRNLLRSMAECVGRVWRLKEEFRTD
ncbi:DEAD/DEAH box helicase [Achlya hypogyna]|uniref:DEAD/DEAH box helicase n=1 Tax=Achlya hypogyna TaxID=1202772 RepID=A0A1V9Z5I8_ACHHY|nr:DEAD/DEAH box helicase [Achlya hypogyna]